MGTCFPGFFENIDGGRQNRISGVYDRIPSRPPPAPPSPTKGEISGLIFQTPARWNSFLAALSCSGLFPSLPRLREGKGLCTQRGACVAGGMLV